MLRFKKGDASPTMPKRYRKHAVVPMLEMEEPFECESREGKLTGQRGDFLVQDGHGGFYPVSAEFHAANYEEVDEPRRRKR